MNYPRLVLRTAAVAASALALAACGNGLSKTDSGSSSEGPSSTEGKVELRMLIASSGDAETKAVTDASNAWADKTGNSVVITPASDMNTELSKTFASSNPYDLVYMDAGRFATYADNGSLYPYGDDFAPAADVYDSLKQTFTYEDKLYCVPKDFSTLGLIINTDMWKAAGLTDADIPTTWDELSDVASTLTSGGHVGLSMTASRDRTDAFMVEAGGWPVNADSTEATADSPENIAALTYLQGLLKDGSMAWANDLDAGWGGEAFGLQKSAMTVEGNWIAGAMSADYPDVNYTVAAMPEGPAGPGTLSFTQCWGVSAKSPAQKQAIDLIASLTTADQQMSNAAAFGVMPALKSVQDQYAKAFPQSAAFISAAESAHGPISLPDFEPVLADFDSDLAGLKTGDPKAILESFQQNESDALGN